MLICVFLIITIILFMVYIRYDKKVIILSINNEKFDNKIIPTESLTNNKYHENNKNNKNNHNTYPYIQYIDWKKEKRIVDSITYYF